MAVNKIMDLHKFKWELDILVELQQRAPDILDFLIAVTQIKKDCDKQVPPVCTAYGILMNARWKKLSLFQKINTVLLGLGNAKSKVHNQAKVHKWRMLNAVKL